MRRLIPFTLLVLLAPLLRAQERFVEVGLLRGKELSQLLVRVPNGTLLVEADGKMVGEVSGKDGLRIAVSGQSITAKSMARSFPDAKRFTFRPKAQGRMRISDLGKPGIERDYQGSITVSRSGTTLLIVNRVPIEDYVAGVVQSEAGDHKGIEYYKLQAVSCRTYALTNARKHLPDGFSVCDGTHCQVYKGVCRIDSIIQAVEATRDMVVVDADIHLIHATFHSNCGGETMNAEDLWSKSEPYLVSTVDTFCMNAPHATWRKTLPRRTWLDYLRRTYRIDTNDSSTVNTVTTFTPGCRSMYIDGVKPLIPLEQVRADMKFNSAFFTIWPNGDDLVFDGRGFGHGIGLCQEGAMRMARAGIPFTDILHHYFADVHLVDLHSLDFFRDEGR